MNRDDHTSLWAVIEGMQLRLEADGLDTAVVDVAVTRGIESILFGRRNGKETRSNLMLPICSLADA